MWHESKEMKNSCQRNLAMDVFIVEHPQNVRTIPTYSPMWSPQSTTLVYGASDAILVDPPFTFDQAKDIAEWVQASGKKSNPPFWRRWSRGSWFHGWLTSNQFKAQVVATRGTIKQMHINVSHARACLGPALPGADSRGLQSLRCPWTIINLTLESATLVAVELIIVQGHGSDCSLWNLPREELVPDTLAHGYVDVHLLDRATSRNNLALNWSASKPAVNQ